MASPLNTEQLRGLLRKRFRNALARYRRALSNDEIWKLGLGTTIAEAKCYPAAFDEVTVDSDLEMICAGYECVGEYSSIRDLRDCELAECSSELVATVSDDVLRVWKMEGI